jgi:hypothetical protein
MKHLQCEQIGPTAGPGHQFRAAVVVVDQAGVFSGEIGPERRYKRIAEPPC